MKQIVESIDQKKKIIVVYHSFGTYLFSNYVHLYPEHSKRICGIIDIGGVPITMYPEIKRLVYTLQDASMDFMVENADLVYE